MSDALQVPANVYKRVREPKKERPPLEAAQSPSVLKCAAPFAWPLYTWTKVAVGHIARPQAGEPRTASVWHPPISPIWSWFPIP